MNKILKWIVIGINLLVLYKAYEWYNNPTDLNSEPAIVFIGQLSTIILLFLEGKSENIKNKFKNFNTGYQKADRDINFGDK
jgi:hypothetical protein